jgi:hypothetical protein
MLISSSGNDRQFAATTNRLLAFFTLAEQKARNRRSIFGKGLVGIAVDPTFAWLGGCDHRMSAGVRVFAGVLIR